MVRRLRRASTESGVWPSRSSSAKVQGEPRRFLGPTVLTSATNCSSPIYINSLHNASRNADTISSATANDVVRYLRPDWFDGSAPGNPAATGDEPEPMRWRPERRRGVCQRPQPEIEARDTCVVEEARPCAGHD